MNFLSLFLSHSSGPFCPRARLKMGSFSKLKLCKNCIVLICRKPLLSILSQVCVIKNRQANFILGDIFYETMLYVTSFCSEHDYLLFVTKYHVSLFLFKKPYLWFLIKIHDCYNRYKKTTLIFFPILSHIC